MDKSFINRDIQETLLQFASHFPIVTLTGPRQSGKTTLARLLFPDLPYINLENPITLQQAKDDTTRFFEQIPTGAVLDEVQNYPEILSFLQTIIDEDRFKGNKQHRFIVTGSSNLALLEKVTQSLAGRTALLTLLPLSAQEILSTNRDCSTEKMVLNGGYPAVWQDEGMRETIINNYYATYIERDIRSLINVKDLRAFQQFIRLCAGRIATEFNASSLSVAVGVSVPTINHWLSILQASYIVHLLTPFHTNLKKRLTKTPKLYFYDTGLAAFLMDIETEQQMQTHPLRGELFENFIINELLKSGFNKGKEEHLYFYRDKVGREIDIIRLKGLSVEGYEIKASKSYHPDFFKHLNYVKSLLGDEMTRTAVIYDGNTTDTGSFNSLYNYQDFRLDA